VADIIQGIANFFNLTKTVTLSLHGIIAATAMVIVFWPPRPIDRIHTPTNFPDVLASGAQCKFNDDPGAGALPIPPPGDIKALRANAVETQDELERAKAELDFCIAIDTSHVGEKEDLIANDEYQIKQIEAERTVLQQQYLAYVKSLSELRHQYRTELERKTSDVTALQGKINGLHQDIKRLQLHVDVEKLYLATIVSRLGEPGRLRPRRGIDDVLAGLSNHVIAFLLLALVLGYAFDPFNRMVSTALFDFKIFKGLNWARRRRFPVMRLKTPPPGPGPIGVPAGGGPGGGGPGGGGPGGMPGGAGGFVFRSQFPISGYAVRAFDEGVGEPLEAEAPPAVWPPKRTREI
jgi:hypothetical protein